MLEMITDRTQADVTKVATYKAKFKVKDTTVGYIQVADIGGGKYLVFDGTQSEYNEYTAGMKGAWNYTDLNRIGMAIHAIATSLSAVGIYVTVTAKTDWVVTDIPTVQQANNLITDLNSLKTICASVKPVPSNLNGMTHTLANQIEDLLLEAYIYAYAINSQFTHCGNAYCGDVGGLLG